jgi:hypothetical protein
MSNTLDHPAQPLTLEGLHRELLALRERVEDLGFISCLLLHCSTVLAQRRTPSKRTPASR